MDCREAVRFETPFPDTEPPDFRSLRVQHFDTTSKMWGLALIGNRTPFPNQDPGRSIGPRDGSEGLRIVVVPLVEPGAVEAKHLKPKVLAVTDDQPIVADKTNPVRQAELASVATGAPKAGDELTLR